MTDTNGMQALAEYGYLLDADGVMRSKRRRGGQRWKPIEGGGFLRFDMQDGQEVPMPHSIGVGFEGVSGLDYRKNPQCYIWTWPEEEVAKIYIAAKIAEDERADERQKGSGEVVYEEAITTEQLGAMVEAQEASVPKKKSWFR